MAYVLGLNAVIQGLLLWGLGDLCRRSENAWTRSYAPPLFHSALVLTVLAIPLAYRSPVTMVLVAISFLLYDQEPATSRMDLSGRGRACRRALFPLAGGRAAHRADRGLRGRRLLFVGAWTSGATRQERSGGSAGIAAARLCDAPFQSGGGRRVARALAQVRSRARPSFGPDVARLGSAGPVAAGPGDGSGLSAARSGSPQRRPALLGRCFADRAFASSIRHSGPWRWPLCAWGSS